ncbi:MAG: hypothetical protein AB7O62_20840 [Pirellulales bacterium]
MNKPLRPDSGFNRPGGGEIAGGGNRPNRPGNGGRPDGIRPGNGGGPDRPGNGNRPGNDRPFFDRDNNRPNIGNDIRGGNRNRFGDNNFINRPTNVNINNNRLNSINRNWQSAIGRPGFNNWGANHPNRINHWNNWGNGVRNGWYGRHPGWNNCFGSSWWANHNHSLCGWHYGCGFNRYPYSYWWTAPVWGSLTSWFSWSAPAQVWSEPAYYDYGNGGNVYYQDNSVYMDGQEIASAEDYAASAAVLATVPPPATQEEAEAAEWMPLGTYAVSASEKDADPSRMLQLAVDKQGIVSGTLYNTSTDKAQTVQGQVDKETQRVAFRIGDSQDIVVETGLYNLTQDQAPVLVHFGTEKTENWLLVRLEQPEEDAATGP